MIEERGLVLAVSDEHIEVQTQIKTTCSGCQQNNQCGTGMVARAMSSRYQTFNVACQQHIEPGQFVRLGIPEQTLLMASVFMYLLPLSLMLTTAVIVSSLVTAEGIVVIATLIAGALGFGLVKLLLSRRQDNFQPVLLGVLPAQSEQIAVQVSH